MAQEIADSTLLDTWGSSGAKIEPDISKIIEGWQLGEQPPHEYMNWLQNTFGSKLNHILKNGVAKWNNETEYLAGATIQHNSSVWICKTTNTNSEPTELNNNWEKIPSLENLALTVDTINDFPTSATTGDTCIVKDLDRGGIFIYDATKVDEDNQGTNFNGWIRHYSGAVNAKWFGAKGDGIIDDTTALQNAINFCLTIDNKLIVPAGHFLLDGGSLTINGKLLIEGAGIESTIFLTTGVPTEAQITRIDWQSSYDTGDYSTNIDPTVSYAIRINSVGVTLKKFSVKNKYTSADITFTSPFNADTDLDVTEYDYGIVTHYNTTILEDVIVTGFWKRSALLIDGSNVGGYGDGFSAHNCKFFGILGVAIRGANGQHISGNDYQDLTSSDTRCASGISDVSFTNCNIGDVGRDIRLVIDSNTRIVRTSSNPSGGMFIQGQLSANSAKRIQGIRFYSCRISAVNPFVFKINYANRVEFFGCHTEYLAGGYLEDGVTPVSGSDVELISTANARGILFVGGEKSGERNRLVLKDNNLQLVSKIGWDNSKREFDIPRLGDTGTFTPTLEGSSGSVTYGVSFGYYARVGQMVFVNGRIDITTKDTISGGLSIKGLPFICSSALGANYNPPVNVPFYRKIITGDAGLGGVLSDGTDTITLVKLRSGNTAPVLSDADIADGCRIDFSVIYVTDNV